MTDAEDERDRPVEQAEHADRGDAADERELRAGHLDRAEPGDGDAGGRGVGVADGGVASVVVTPPRMRLPARLRRLRPEPDAPPPRDKWSTSRQDAVPWVPNRAGRATLFDSVDDVVTRLADVGYLASTAVATTVFLADRLGKPLLVEGPAGVGKTELARAVADATGAGLVRLQCYEGIDEARALYEWNHAKQLLRIQASQGEEWDATRDDVFSEEFLLTRPLLTAIRRAEPTVLLVDETDKADVEVEGLLLEVLGDFQVTVPELGTIVATQRPFTLLTSNATRELSEALKRRCLFLHLDFPDAELERRIVASRVPQLPEALAEQLVRVIGVLRGLDLRKAPSVSETIDWARTLVALGLDTLDDDAVRQSLGVVLKHRSDLVKASSELRLN